MRGWRTFLSIVLTLVATACSGGTSTPTSTPPQPIATSTPAPTPSQPVATSTPTSTPPQPIATQGQIAFASDRDGNLEIYVMNADGTGVERLTDDPADDIGPDWSPDGASE